MLKIHLVFAEATICTLFIVGLLAAVFQAGNTTEFSTSETYIYLQKVLGILLSRVRQLRWIVSFSLYVHLIMHLLHNHFRRSRGPRITITSTQPNNITRPILQAYIVPHSCATIFRVASLAQPLPCADKPAFHITVNFFIISTGFTCTRHRYCHYRNVNIARRVEKRRCSKRFDQCSRRSSAQPTKLTRQMLQSVTQHVNDDMCVYFGIEDSRLRRAAFNGSVPTEDCETRR